MEIKGTVIQKFGLETGTTKTGNSYKKQFILIETQETYPKKVYIQFWGDKTDALSNVYVGAIVTVSVNIESREFNGKYYTDVSGWKVNMESAPQTAPAHTTAPAPTPTPVASPKNPELEKATKLEADKYYKILANTRAQLFGLCTIERMPNENNAESVSLRENLALQIMDMQSDVDIAYSRYRYVCEHGKLPEQVSDADQSEELPTNPILLERKRVNLIKSINKLKAKEATPERVTLLQKLSSTLKLVTDGVNKFLEG